MDSLDFMWRTYDQIGEWIRFADAKAAGVLAAQGILASVMLTRIPPVVAAVNIGPLHIAFTATILTGIATISLALRCIAPILSLGEPTSLVYFAHIAKRYKSGPDYAEDALVAWASKKVAEKELAHQIWANSCVALSKHKRVSWAIWLLTANAIATILLLVLSLAN